MNVDQLTILLVDDNAVDLKVLSAIIRKLGHHVIECRSANDALTKFDEYRPDIILLDVMMPEINGLTLAKRIREIADYYIPIIFLSSLTDNDSLIECLEHGGDDLLSKPYNIHVIKAKINAFVRMHKIKNKLRTKQDILNIQHDQLKNELNIAHALFDNVSQFELLKKSNINYLLSSKSIFNGEIIFAACKPSGSLYILVGDISGQGVPAALASIPLAEIFYGMTEKGFLIKEILREINEKLHTILPVGIFCSAVMLELNYRQHTVEVWQGGIPTGYIVSPVNKNVTAIPSQHLPLAVLPSKQFNSQTTIYPLDDNDSIVFFTNSIFTLKTQTGDLLNELSLKAMLKTLVKEHNIYHALYETLNATNINFINAHTTLMEVSLANTKVRQVKHATSETASGPHDFSTQFTFQSNTLKNYDPVPTCVNTILDIPGLKSFHGRIYTILSELYINALDHGLLGLKSMDKSNEAGFESYYEQRREKLKALEEGHIVITLTHQMKDRKGILEINVKDSGKGFDIKTIERDNNFSGRGVSIVKSLSDTTCFSPKGNAVTATIIWDCE